LLQQQQRPFAHEFYVRLWNESNNRSISCRRWQHIYTYSDRYLKILKWWLHLWTNCEMRRSLIFWVVVVVVGSVCQPPGVLYSWRHIIRVWIFFFSFLFFWAPRWKFVYRMTKLPNFFFFFF
jgi:hypothetical protein